MTAFTPWRPASSLWAEMAQFQREMDRLLGRAGLDLQVRPGLAISYPAVNIWEDEDCVYVESELPGIRLEDLEITVTGDSQLTIKGMRQPADMQDQQQSQKIEWHRQERPMGTFERSIPLPIGVDPNQVDARLEKGVLTLKMAKSESSKTRRIPVAAE